MWYSLLVPHWLTKIMKRALWCIHTLRCGNGVHKPTYTVGETKNVLGTKYAREHWFVTSSHWFAIRTLYVHVCQ